VSSLYKAIVTFQDASSLLFTNTTTLNRKLSFTKTYFPITAARNSRVYGHRLLTTCSGANILHRTTVKIFAMFIAPTDRHDNNLC